MTNEEYFAIAADIFPLPDNPGAWPEVVVGMTAAVIAELTRLHREATQVYRTYHNVDQAIKKLIIEAFDDAYLNALSDEVVGYANCTSLEILTYLLTYYAMIAPTELTQNYERLNTAYDPNQPIETLFQKIQDARCGHDHQCCIHSRVQHWFVSRRMTCMAIESDSGQYIGPI
jgi:hypothetical protein